MKRSHYIGLDTHGVFTELAAVRESGRMVKRDRCPTTIPDLVKAIETIPRPRVVAFEEGPLADWLWRNLKAHADDVVVCEPRRNHLIAKESDKDDPIDAEKLAQLVRGGYVKRVHHPETQERAIFKQHVALYHDGVRDRVRKANRIGGLLRQHGVCVREKAFADPAARPALLARLPESRLLRGDLKLLWRGYDQAARRVQRLRQRLVRVARQEEPVRRFVELPGIGWVRAATWFVYVDTPWRFARKTKLWKYVGLGLERRRSGDGPTRLYLCRRANRGLKNILLGAARSAVRSGDNPFADRYRRWKEDGCSPGIALRNTARWIAATLWGMWKNGNAYHPEWVARTTAEDQGQGRCRHGRKPEA